MKRHTDRRALAWATAASIAWLGTPTSNARAQTPDRAIEFEDLGFTALSDHDARSLAISAPIPAAMDVTTIVGNPAGLSRIGRPHGFLALGWRGRSHGFRYAGSTRTETTEATALEFVGAAFPIPVLRGSLVPAVSVHRAYACDLQLGYTGFNVPDNRDDTFSLQQSGSVYAYTLGISVGIADGIAIGGSVSLLDGNVSALRQYDTSDHVPSPAIRTFVSESTEIDMTGVVGRLGVEVIAHRHLQIALVLTSPQAFDVDAAVTRETTEWVVNDVGTFTRESEAPSTDLVLPYRIEVGLAVPWDDLTVAVQLGRVDWAQAMLDGHRLLTDRGEAVLREVVDARGGIEWTTPLRTLRVRAGVAHARGALGLVEADRVDNDRLERVTTETGRTRVALGVGVLLRGNITVDGACAHSRGERESATIGDDVSVTSVLLQGSYWF